MHGKTSEVYHGQQGLFRDMENPVTSARYHSLLLDRERLPEELTVTAWTEQREVMGIQHTDRPIEGVQFHPESILTERGRAMLNQFVASIPLHGKEPDPA